MIRNIEDKDLEQLKEIHEQFFQKEFTFHDFLSGAIYSFLITDDVDNNIITACCIRPIAEMVALTNLNKSPRLRRRALYESLEIAKYTLQGSSMRQIHAFIQDKKWESQLIKAGFKPCTGRAIYFNL